MLIASVLPASVLTASVRIVFLSFDSGRKAIALGIGRGHPAALDLVVGEGAIDASPDVRIANGLDGAKMFPSEFVLAPFGQSVPQAAKNVAIVGDERDFTGLF